MAFNLLSEPIRKYVRDKRWEELRPIQAAAIEKILSTDKNFILASRTASGKTEAAFLPILSKLDISIPGVQVLYVSPLIALINDQFNRIEELCKYLDIPVTKWHGESSRSLKYQLINSPSGIVLITPESLEAMFVNHPYNIKKLFSNLRFVVIDEIHSFLGTERGTQLKSILFRLLKVNNSRFSIVGLSATIGDYIQAKKFTGDEAGTTVLLDRTAKEVHVYFKYYESEGEELPLDLLKDLYRETRESKVLVFPNSRGRAEEIAVKLKKISDRVQGHSNYFSHHSSVDKEVREYVEFFAKNSTHQSFCISCTSTLELGIDIGAVDQVVQVDATFSIASLIQRVGRSGRRNDEPSRLVLYATDQWNLLQSLACWLLFQEGFIEPPFLRCHAYDLLLHQALSIVKSSSGILVADLDEQLRNNFAFTDVGEDDRSEIIQHLVDTDLLELLGKELIIGVSGEKIVNTRDFYSVFQREENYKVVSAGNTIGEIPHSPQIVEDENILLAARVWKIVAVDDKSKKIEVRQAKDGKKPKFSGGGGVLHPKVRAKMLEIVLSRERFSFLDQSGNDKIEKIRDDFSVFALKDATSQRPLLLKEKEIELFTFTGTRVNRSVKALLSIAGLQCYLDEGRSVIEVECSYSEFQVVWQTLDSLIDQVDSYIFTSLGENPNIMSFSKWAKYLPDKFQNRLLKTSFYDFEEACAFVRNVQFVVNSESQG